jgi:hypothetical protein
MARAQSQRRPWMALEPVGDCLLLVGGGVYIVIGAEQEAVNGGTHNDHGAIRDVNGAGFMIVPK